MMQSILNGQEECSLLNGFSRLVNQSGKGIEDNPSNVCRHKIHWNPEAERPFLNMLKNVSYTYNFYRWHHLYILDFPDLQNISMTFQCTDLCTPVQILFLIVNPQTKFHV